MSKEKHVKDSLFKRPQWIIGGAVILILVATLVWIPGSEPPSDSKRGVVADTMPERRGPADRLPPDERPGGPPGEPSEAPPEPPKPVVLIDPPDRQPALDQTWKDEPKVLRLLAWPDYFDPATLARFEKKTGIKVDYKTFESLDSVAHAIKTGKPAFDVMIPSSAVYEQVGGAAAFRRLYIRHLPNRKTMDPALTGILANLDPGNDNAAPYLWGTAGVAYHTKTVQSKAGTKAPMDSWDMVFTPRWAERLVDCGLYFPSSPDEVMDLGLIALGKSPYTESAADYVELEDRLLKLRPFITGFHSGGKVEELVSGQACAVVGWSVNLMVAHMSSADATGLRAVDYVIPYEGTLLWFDLLAVPKNARHPGNAHRFIDFMMTADAGAESSNYLWYATANAAAKDKIVDQVATHPGLYPRPEILQNSYIHKPLTKKARRLRDTVWARFTKVVTPQTAQEPTQTPPAE